MNWKNRCGETQSSRQQRARDLRSIYRRLFAAQGLRPVRTMDASASRLDSANLDAAAGRIEDRIPKTPLRSPSRNPSARPPNNGGGRIDQPRGSTGGREGASASVRARAAHIPAEAADPRRFLPLLDNKIRWGQSPPSLHRRRPSGPASTTRAGDRRWRHSTVPHCDGLCSLGLDR